MPRRNLVFIMSDQQRRDSMGCYGSEWAETPNLDALADSGHLFENAYVTQAVCTPARASIMTGLYPHTAGPTVNKLPLSPDIPVLAEMVSEDYLCGYMGKWHLGDDVIRQHGFDVWISTEESHRETYTRREHRNTLSDYHHHLVANGFEPDAEAAGERIFSPAARSRLPEEFQMASYLAGRAEQFIGRKQRPAVHPVRQHLRAAFALRRAVRRPVRSRPAPHRPGVPHEARGRRPREPGSLRLLHAVPQQRQRRRGRLHEGYAGAGPRPVQRGGVA